MDGAFGSGRLGGLPGGQQVQCVGGLRSWLGGVDGEGEAGVGDHVDTLVGQLKVTDDCVVELLAARAVESDVVRARLEERFRVMQAAAS